MIMLRVTKKILLSGLLLLISTVMLASCQSGRLVILIKPVESLSSFDHLRLPKPSPSPLPPPSPSPPPPIIGKDHHMLFMISFGVIASLLLCYIVYLARLLVKNRRENRPLLQAEDAAAHIQRDVGAAADDAVEKAEEVVDDAAKPLLANNNNKEKHHKGVFAKLFSSSSSSTSSSSKGKEKSRKSDEK